MTRRNLAGVGLALGSLALTGCVGTTTEVKDERTKVPANGGTTNTSTTALKVGLVLDTGGPDDKSFNAAAVSGLNKAKAELGLDAASKYVESKSPADYKTNLTSLANAGYTVIVAVGNNLQDALAEVAPQFPNVKFAIVDAKAPDLPNCAALNFKEEEGCFLAGFLAASMSQSHKIGFVGGQKIPLIEKFEAGYKAGARTADAKIVVLPSYTNNWEDQNAGRSQADQQFGSGADIIFQAAGKGGLGVITAAEAKGKGYYAIGVDQDQDGIAPGRVLTSMVKHVDTTVYDTIKQVKDNKFSAGMHVFGLKENGVGLSEFKYTKNDISGPVMKRLETLKQMVIDGKVVPPTTLTAEAGFQPPKLP